MFKAITKVAALAPEGKPFKVAAVLISETKGSQVPEISKKQKQLYFF